MSEAYDLIVIGAGSAGLTTGSSSCPNGKKSHRGRLHMDWMCAQQGATKSGSGGSPDAQC